MLVVRRISRGWSPNFSTDSAFAIDMSRTTLSIGIIGGEKSGKSTLGETAWSCTWLLLSDRSSNVC